MYIAKDLHNNLWFYKARINITSENKQGKIKCLINKAVFIFVNLSFNWALTSQLSDALMLGLTGL